MIQVAVTYTLPITQGGLATVERRGDATRVSELKDIAVSSALAMCKAGGFTPIPEQGSFAVDELRTDTCLT